MKPASSRTAFTLIELLVVISIILVATSVLFVAGGGGSVGIKLSSAERIASSIAQGARGQALLKNAETRLIIYSDNNTDGDPEKILRYFGIVYKAQDESGNEGWKAATQGTYLPEGIYFDPTLSANQSNDLSAIPRTNLEYPRQSVQGEGGPEYYYYEFNANGTMKTAEVNFTNSWLVMRTGTLKPGEGDVLEVDFSGDEQQNLKSALIFRRVGTTTLVTDPDEISGD